MINKVESIFEKLNEIPQVLSFSNSKPKVQVTVILPKKEIEELSKNIVDHFSKTAFFIHTSKGEEPKLKFTFKKFKTPLGVDLILKEDEGE